MMTVAAFSLQQNKADQRDIVIEFDRRAAVRAVRSRPDDGFLLWQSENADIQETADQCPKNDRNYTQHSDLLLRITYPQPAEPYL